MVKFSLLIFAVVIGLASCNVDKARVQTDVNNLSPLERLYIKLAHPEVPLDKVTKDGDHSLFNYEGFFEAYGVDVPMLFLQLVKFGDEIRLPGYQFTFYFYWCYMGSCIGWNDIYNYKNPVIRSAQKTELKSSINGTIFKVDMTIPEIIIDVPEFTLHETDLISNDQVYWRGFYIVINNYTVQLTGNVSLHQSIGLQVSDLDISVHVDKILMGKNNATHVNPDGTSEEWGKVEGEELGELVNEMWDTFEGQAKLTITDWLNCFLSDGRNMNGICDTYFLNDSLHHASFVQLMHSFGLSALNDRRRN